MESHHIPQLRSWEVNQKINRFLLNQIEESLLAERATDQGKSIGGQFAHIHTVRMMWLQVANPTVWESLERINKQQIHYTYYLQQQLKSSAIAFTQVLEEGFNRGKIKGFSESPDMFLSYLIAHESHHRGQIMMILKVNGHTIPKELGYTIWDWAKMAKL